jgi:CBS domain-containing protein
VSVPISSILDRKGREVFTTTPDASVSDAVAALASHGVGALVVTEDGAVAGVFSERDVVRRLVDAGSDCLSSSVRDVMTADVHTCAPSATVDELMRSMTDRRIRHVPVVDGGELVGLVSIGDVVKLRLDELELQTEQLEGYVSGSY